MAIIIACGQTKTVEFYWVSYSSGGSSYYPFACQAVDSLPITGTANIQVEVTVIPPCTPGHFHAEAWFPNGGAPGVDYSYWQSVEEIFVPSCICTPIIRCDAINRGDSGYDLSAQMRAGDCATPLSGIVWTPEPTSGQGTMNVIYADCFYNSTYEGSVVATDNNGCTGLAEFSFMWQPGGYPPSCQK